MSNECPPSRQRSISGFIIAALCCIAGIARADERPNILFLFADDQCYETIHALGNREIQTPNLDRLVNEGTTFTRAYNMGGWHGAICVASRTMLNTGRFLWHANDVDKTCEQERQAGRLWSEYMKTAGYRTYMTGKWHIQAKAELAFHEARHVRPGMPPTTPESYNRPIQGQPDVWSPYDPKFRGYWEGGGKHWSEIVADDALDYISDAKQRDQPFFMYVAFNAPHDPRQSPREFVEMYPQQNILVPENFLPLYPYREAMGCSPSLRDEKLAPFPRTEYSIRTHRGEYYALITHLDTQIGRILQALEASGKAENTWIVYTADHGLAVGHHGLVGKQNMYDHSVRVPFLVKGPGVEAGQRIDSPIYLQSVMPTTLELAGIKEKPAHVEFDSLLPLLRGKETAGDKAVYGAYMMLQRMVTDGGHKLILYPEAKVFRLYHIAEDPMEMRDVAGKGESLSIARRLFSKLLELQSRTGDPLDLRKTYPSLLDPGP